METKVNYAVVGGFVLALGTVFVGIILWLASGGGFQVKYDKYLALLPESVAGLNLNAPVKYRGVDVGKVESIKLDPNNPQQVRLVFAIERGTPIKQDTEAQLKSQGLTGITYVELAGGSPGSPPLTAPDGEMPVIKTKPSLTAQLETVVQRVLASVEKTSNAVNAVLSDENREALRTTLANISTVTQAIASRRDSIDAMLANASKTFENTARVSAQLGPTLDRIGPTIDKIGRTADALQATAVDAGEASRSAGKAVDAIGADVKRFTSETLPEAERLLGELTTLSGSLRRLSDQAERNPAGFVFGKQTVPNGPGEGGSK